MLDVNQLYVKALLLGAGKLLYISEWENSKLFFFMFLDQKIYIKVSSEF